MCDCRKQQLTCNRGEYVLTLIEEKMTFSRSLAVRKGGMLDEGMESQGNCS